MSSAIGFAHLALCNRLSNVIVPEEIAIGARKGEPAVDLREDDVWEVFQGFLYVDIFSSEEYVLASRFQDRLLSYLPKVPTTFEGAAPDEERDKVFPQRVEEALARFSGRIAGRRGSSSSEDNSYFWHTAQVRHAFMDTPSRSDHRRPVRKGTIYVVAPIRLCSSPSSSCGHRSRSTVAALSFPLSCAVLRYDHRVCVRRGCNAQGGPDPRAVVHPWRGAV